jgi:hypothetical protein
MGYLGYKPADKPLTAADITDSIITSAKITDATIVNGDIANSTIALAKLSATGTPSASTFLRGDNSWVAAGGANTPAFYAKLGSNQTLTSGATAKIQINTEIYDSNSCYDNTTNYRFTPTVAGKYYVFASIRFRHASGTNYTSQTFIYKNGSNYVGTVSEFQNNVDYGQTVQVSGIVDMNGSTDYLELYEFMEWHSSGTLTAQSANNATYFGAYKIIE